MPLFIFLVAPGIVYVTIRLLDVIHVQKPPCSLCYDSVCYVRCELGKVTFILPV